MAVEHAQLSGWGRVGYAACDVSRPESLADAAALLTADTRSTLIPRGLGRSYGDPAMNDGNRVLLSTGMNYIHAFDSTTGVVDCEAGVSLCELIDAFLPRGYFLPVTPGTKYVTVGGAIANDVHGKNHHGVGSFGNFLESLTLLLPTGEATVCSPTENTDLFWATIGGIGLTGLILRARLRLTPVQSGYMKVDYRRCTDLDDVLGQMKEGDHRYTYSVAWVDCLARGKALGRSVLMRGDHASPEDVARTGAVNLVPQRRAALPIPVDFPGFALNHLSIAAFNELFYRKHGNRDGSIVDYDSYFYPLDKLTNWNRMYGRSGFMQYQATFPAEEVAGVVKALERLAETRRASFLAVLKVMGPSNDGWLSYPIPGYTLNLDLPNKPGTVEFLRSLDRILLDHGGRLYFAKDACALPETIAEMYPRLKEFQELRERIDPREVLASNLARRLKIVETAPHVG